MLHVQSDGGLVGGIASFIRELTQATEPDRVRHVVVVPDLDSAPAQASATYKAELVALPPTYGFASFLRYVSMLAKVVDAADIEVIHAHALRSAAAASMVAVSRGVPLVYTNHGLRYRQKRGRLGRAAFWLAEFFVTRAAFVSCSIRPTDHDILSSSRLGQGSRQTVIQTRLSMPVHRTHEQFTTWRPLRLLGVGSMVPVKRTDRFLDWVEALARSNMRLEAAWIGDGPLLAKFKDEVSARGLPITATGQVSRAEAGEWMRRSDLLLVTSDFEVCPLSVLEAYACGLPVVCSEFEGVLDFIEPDRTGLVVNGDDPPAVASAIAALVHGCGLEPMARRAEEAFIERFSDARRMARAYAELYDAALEARR